MTLPILWKLQPPTENRLEYLKATTHLNFDRFKDETKFFSTKDPEFYEEYTQEILDSYPEDHYEEDDLLDVA